MRIFSVLFAVGGLFMIFGNRGLIIRVFLHPPEAEVSTLLLFLLKEMGGMVLMVSAMLFRASRDPVRDVAVVDGLKHALKGGHMVRKLFTRFIP